MDYVNDPIGNRTRDLVACSAVPQRNAPTRVPSSDVVYFDIIALGRGRVDANEAVCHHLMIYSCLTPSSSSQPPSPPPPSPPPPLK